MPIDLDRAFPGVAGFSAGNVWRKRASYLAWTPELLAQPARETGRKAKLTQPARELGDSRPPEPLSFAMGFLEMAELTCERVVMNMSSIEAVIPATPYSLRHSVELYVKHLVYDWRIVEDGQRVKGNDVLQIFETHEDMIAVAPHCEPDSGSARRDWLNRLPSLVEASHDLTRMVRRSHIRTTFSWSRTKVVGMPLARRTLRLVFRKCDRSITTTMNPTANKPMQRVDCFAAAADRYGVRL